MNDILQVSGAHQVFNFGVKLWTWTHQIVWLVEDSCVITSLNIIKSMIHEIISTPLHKYQVYLKHVYEIKQDR